MTSPSTDWKEVVAPGEAELFERLARDLAGVQADAAKKLGGLNRALHAKPNLAARATFEVLAGLPEHARAGLFSEPKRYEAVVRFSNGSPAHQHDKKPDVRGMAVKVMGVGGKKLIPGLEHAPTQDFLSILSASQPFRTPEEFVWFVVAARSPATLMPKALFKLGPGPLFSLLGKLRQGLGAKLQPISSNRYYSALPFTVGRYAAKSSWVPLDAGGSSGAALDPDLGGGLARQLAAGPVRWELQLQFFTDEKHTPLEDGTVDWEGPWLPVARLTLQQQDVKGAAGQSLATWAEQLSFDPWHAQAELRPLGAFMRARNAAYRVSTQARKVLPEPATFPEGAGAATTPA
jgi:hypothetical protein